MKQLLITGILILNWTYGDPNAVYTIYQGNTKVLASDFSGMSYIVSRLKVGTRHCFHVVATVNGVDSPSSNIACGIAHL